MIQFKPSVSIMETDNVIYFRRGDRTVCFTVLEILEQIHHFGVIFTNDSLVCMNGKVIPLIYTIKPFTDFSKEHEIVYNLIMGEDYFEKSRDKDFVKERMRNLHKDISDIYYYSRSYTNMIIDHLIESVEFCTCFEQDPSIVVL